MDLSPIAQDEPITRRSSKESSAYGFRDDVLAIFGDQKTHLTTTHEVTHFLEHCSTPFGAFREENHFRQYLCAYEFLKQYGGRIYVPVYSWAKGVRVAPRTVPTPDDPELFSALLDQFLIPWSRAVQLDQVLDGLDHPVVRETTEAQAVSLLSQTEETIDPFLGLRPTSGGKEGQGSAVATGEGRATLPACPALGVPIGAYHLSELIAQLQEGFEELDLASTPPAYWVLAVHALESYGRQHLEEVANGDKRIPRTCLALADLALFTPIGSIYSPLRRPESQWSDVHPGHRFLTGFRLVVESGRWISDLSESEALDDWVCERLGWVKPRRFLELGATLTHDRLARHRHACAIRLNEFAAPYLLDRPTSLLAAERFFSDHMPIVQYPERGTVCPVPEGDETNRTALLKLRDCFFVRLFWYALRRWDGPIEEFLFPEAVPFSTYFANIECADDLIALIVERYPWASPARFIPLPPPS